MTTNSKRVMQCIQTLMKKPIDGITLLEMNFKKINDSQI